MTTVQNLMTLVKANSQLFQQVNTLYGNELAPNFNSLDFWHIDENKVTKILAFLLNPKEKHSHGDMYFRHFLKKFNLNQFHFSETDTIKVHLERKNALLRFIFQNLEVLKPPFLFSNSYSGINFLIA